MSSKRKGVAAHVKDIIHLNAALPLKKEKNCQQDNHQLTPHQRAKSGYFLGFSIVFP